MTIKLKKQVIEILKVLKKKPSEILAKDLAKELKTDYIVLMSAINDLIEYDLGGFKEEEITNTFIYIGEKEILLMKWEKSNPKILMLYDTESKAIEYSNEMTDFLHKKPRFSIDSLTEKAKSFCRF